VLRPGHFFWGLFPSRAAPEGGFAAPRPLTRPGLSALAAERLRGTRAEDARATLTRPGLLALAAEAKAERVATGELCRLGWKEEDLVARRKSGPANSAIAERLRTETALAITAVASAVNLGRSKSANARLQARLGRAAASDRNQGRLQI